MFNHTLQIPQPDVKFLQNLRLIGRAQLPENTIKIN